MILMKYLIIFLFLCSIANSEEKKWRIEKVGDMTTVSINGNTQHGDVLMFWLKKYKGKCDVLGHTFTFYTAINNANIQKLKNKLVPIKIKNETHNNGKFYADVIYLSPFLLGHRLTFSIGQYKVKEHIEYLSKYKLFDVTIVDNHEPLKEKNIINDFKAKEYFDIQNNSWKLTGLKQAILKGQRLCLQ